MDVKLAVKVDVDSCELRPEVHYTEEEDLRDHSLPLVIENVIEITAHNRVDVG